MQGAAWPLGAASGAFSALGLNRIDLDNVLSKRCSAFEVPEYELLPLTC